MPNKSINNDLNVVCLAGGVGGAKLAHGLAQILLPNRLTIIGNTGDDFVHCGLRICPDLDTVMYTLAGAADQEKGWGRANESWRTMKAMADLGGPDWFNLGDTDLATHMVRTHLMEHDGRTLTAATQHLCQQFGVGPALLPMCNEPAPTTIETADSILPFQVWFVQERWQPEVKTIHLAEDPIATPQVRHALENADIVIIAPSNPFVSIDPILNVYPIRALIEDVPQAVVAVSPIISGEAVKGPAAKLMRELGMESTAAAVANYYDVVLDGFVYDKQDEGSVTTDELPLLCTNTLMHTPADRVRLAQEVLAFAAELIEEEL